jgi:hypothetical protein
MLTTQRVQATRGTRVQGSATLMGVLGAWLAGAVALGGAQWFVTDVGQPPLGLLLAVTVPVLVFASAYGLSARFRGFVEAGEPEWLTTLQSWRILGGVFLVLLSFGLLPAAFALPAGIGDVAIGVTAPFIARALARQGPSRAGRLFAAWQGLGILDLVVAICVGASVRTFPQLTEGSANSELMLVMSQLPLSLVPTFAVPLFVILHLASLVQLRRLIREAREEPTAH